MEKEAAEAKMADLQQALQALKDEEIGDAIYLGYSLASASLAEKITKFIKKYTKALILDWRFDFDTGNPFFREFSVAVKKCCADIFLFTKGDSLSVRLKMISFDLKLLRAGA